MEEIGACASFCAICKEMFSEARPCIVLKCNHIFCSVCIAQLEAEGDKRCSLCRKPWSDEIVSKNPKEDESKKIKVKKLADREILCPDHSLPVIYWCFDCQILICMRCPPSTHRFHDFDVTEEGATTMEAIVSTAFEKVKNIAHWERKELAERMESTSFTLEQVKNLQGKLEEDIRKYEIQSELQMKKEEELDDLEKNIRQIGTLGKEAAIYSYCQTTLKKIEENQKDFPGEVRAADKNVSSLLANIVCSYKAQQQESEFGNDIEATDANNSESSDNLNAFLTNLSRKEHLDVRTLTEQDVINAAQELKHRKSWLIDSCLTARAALHVLQDKQCAQPDFVKIVFLDDRSIIPLDLLVEVLTKLRKCVLNIRCLDTFYKPSGDSAHKTFQRITAIHQANEKCVLQTVCGHFDANTLACLPESVCNFSLAVNDPSDAQLAASLSSRRNLGFLDVSISKNVNASDLKVLPSDPKLAVDFYAADDDCVDNIVKCCDALIPPGKKFWVYLPKCCLTITGAQLLTSLLSEKLVERLCFEEQEVWDNFEKEKITDLLKGNADLNCSVEFGVQRKFNA